MFACSGENETADSTAASAPWSARPATGVDRARRRRLGAEHAVSPLRLRLLAPAGLRRAHHHGVDDVRETATAKCAAQGPDAAVRPQGDVIVGGPGRR